MALMLCCMAQPATAQGYRLRVDSRLQSVSWRGIERDSLPRGQALPDPGGGFVTPDGHAANCDDNWCHSFLPGPMLQAVPWVTTADVTAWGFGINGLRLRANLRHATDLGDVARWPGTEPDLQVVEGYLDYQRDNLGIQAGRQFLASRLGAYGLDGLRANWRHSGMGIDVAGFAGWGLARGSVLPVTSPAMNPLDDFQPRDRQVVVGGEAGFSGGTIDARIEYRREVDPAVDKFVSERAAGSVSLRPLATVRVAAGAAYDLALANWGSADASVTWTSPIATFNTGVRRYMPFFDLWTIWGAFSPVAFNAWHGGVTASPLRGVTVQARGERYRFDETGTATPLVSVEDRGWRFEAGASWQVDPQWEIGAGHSAEFGPGASSLGYDMRVDWQPRENLAVGVHGATLRRPLELRWNDATLAIYGGDVEWRPGQRWRFGIGVTRVDEKRDRPDAGAVDWDQWRLSARITLLHGTDVDRYRLPPAIRSGNPQ